MLELLSLGLSLFYKEELPGASCKRQCRLSGTKSVRVSSQTSAKTLFNKVSMCTRFLVVIPGVVYYDQRESLAKRCLYTSSIAPRPSFLELIVIWRVTHPRNSLVQLWQHLSRSLAEPRFADYKALVPLTKCLFRLDGSIAIQRKIKCDYSFASF